MATDYRDAVKRSRKDFDERVRQIRGVKDGNPAHAQKKLQILAWATSLAVAGPESPDAQVWHDAWKALDDAAVALLEGRALALPNLAKK